MTKKITGQLISIKFTDRKMPITGIVVDYNDDWTLLKYNPVDYIVDGFIILRHKNIEGYRHDTEEKFREKVIKLKGKQSNDSDKIPIDDLQTILTYLTDNFGVFQFSTKSDASC